MRAKLSHGDGARCWPTPYRDRDSSWSACFAAADALLRRRAGAEALAAGDLVDVLPLARA